jgi:hypothetical protein
MDGGRLLFKNFYCISIAAGSRICSWESAAADAFSLKREPESQATLPPSITKKARSRFCVKKLMSAGGKSIVQRAGDAEKKWDCREIKQLSRNLAGGLTRA